MRPEARIEGLLVEEVGDELVIYDVQRHRAHRLNRSAALVWRSCDGHKTVAELTRSLQQELSPAADKNLVCRAVHRLGKARLLREPASGSAGAPRMTRRQALSRLGRTAALAFLVPAVTSITAPTLVWANEDFCEEQPCVTNCRDQCRSNHDCPSNNPICLLQACNRSSFSNVRCRFCLQRRCTRHVTDSQVGGGGD
jgi:hypothetical protein